MKIMKFLIMMTLRICIFEMKSFSINNFYIQTIVSRCKGDNETLIQLQLKSSLFSSHCNKNDNNGRMP